MKKISRIILIVCILTLLTCAAVFFAGCGKKDKTPPPVDGTTYCVIEFHLRQPDSTESEHFKTIKVKRQEKIDEKNIPNLYDLRPAGFDPAKEGHGWYDSNDNPLNSTDPITKDQTFYSKWVPNGKHTDVSLNDGMFQEITEKINILDEEGKIKSKPISTGVWRYIDMTDPDLGGAVPNGSISFNFNEKFEQAVSQYASWTIWTNEKCNRQDGINQSGDNYLTNLKNGDNFFYLKVVAEDNILSKVYKINIVLDPQYRVTVSLKAGDTGRREFVTRKGGLIPEWENYQTQNPGYEFVCWQYLSIYNRDEFGDIIDADEKPHKLVEEDGVFYYVDEDGEKYPEYRYVDENGKLFATELDKDSGTYYQCDSNGHRVQEDGKDVKVDPKDCINVLDENGYPIYHHTIEPLKPRPAVLCEWDFGKTKVFDNVNIIGQWKPISYDIELNLADDGYLRYKDHDGNVRGASYDGSTKTTVEYGIAKTALADKINTLGSSLPTHPYAVFDGWWFHPGAGDPVCVVDGNGNGVSGWVFTQDAELRAHWKIKAFAINYKCDPPQGGTVKCVNPDGEDVYEIEYGGEIKLIAEPSENYSFEGWEITDQTGEPKTKKDNPLNYKLEGFTFDQIREFKGLEIRAIFKEKQCKVKFDYLPEAETSPEEFIFGYNDKDYPPSRNYGYGSYLGIDDLPNDLKDKKEAYTFTGYWEIIDESDGTRTPWPTDEYFIQIKKDITVHAVWIANERTIEICEAVYKGIPAHTIHATLGDEPVEFEPVDINRPISGAPVPGGEDEGPMPEPVEPITIGDKIREAAENFADTVVVSQSSSAGKYVFHCEGIGSGDTPDKVKVGDTVTLRYDDTENENRYKFLGWFLLGDDGNLEPLPDSVKNDFEYTIQKTREVRLVALWDYNFIKLNLITIDEAGNPKGEAPITVPFDRTSDSNLPDEDVVKSISEDIAFDGWWSHPETGDPVRWDARGEGAELGQFHINNPELCGSDSVVLYTHWKKLEYFEKVDGKIMGFTSAGAERAENKYEWEIPFEDGITEIAEEAFAGCKTITRITIKGNITKIGARAFSGCASLKKIVFDGEFKGLTVEDGVFENCSPDLREVKFPDNTKAIGKYVFKGCSGIETLTYPGCIPVGELFSDVQPLEAGWVAAVQGGTKYWLPEGLKKVTISNTEERLCDHAFENTSHILTVTLSGPNDENKPYIKKIGNYAFSGSTVEIDTKMLENVEEIGYYAFKDCGNLEGELKLNLEKVSKIKDGAFQSCNGLVEITLSADLEDIPAACFKDCPVLSTAALGGVKHIGAAAFEGCEALGTPTSTDSVEEIGGRAFKGCNISDLFTEESQWDLVRSVGREAFAGTKWQDENNKNKVLCIGKVIYYDNDAASTEIKKVLSPEDENTKYITIAPGAFSGKDLPEELNLKNLKGLITIEIGAFEGCSELSTINLPENLVAIKADAFKGSTVATVDMKENECKSLSTIGRNAFRECTNLTTVNFFVIASSEQLAAVPKIIIGDNVFNGCEKLTEITLPDNLGALGEYVFAGCIELKTVNFIDNSNFVKTGDTESKYDRNNSVKGLITEIPVGAFKNDTKLGTDVEIPYFIKKIGDEAFYGCSSMERIIGSYKFETTGEEGESVTDEVKPIGNITIGANAFNGCENLDNPDIGKIRELGISAFEGCAALKKIAGLPGTIPARAFYKCTALSEPEFPGTIRVGESAFTLCISLERLTTKDGTSVMIDKVEKDAFRLCSSLTSVLISANTIGEQAFYSCRGLTSVDLSRTASIGDGAFSSCDVLETVTFGNSLNDVGIHAFAECSRLESVTLPDSIDTVGNEAFQNCVKLTDVVIGAGIGRIGEGAFVGCAAGNDPLIVTFRGEKVPIIDGRKDGPGDLFASVADYKIYVKTGYKESFVGSGESWASYVNKIYEYSQF